MAPFTNQRSQASLRVLGKGCAFRHTTYRVEDHAPPEAGLGVPLNHPRFLECISAPTSAWLLEMSPGQWCDTLSRDQAMTAAMQLHKDVCLMNTNLDILDQYALALHGTASKILQRTIGGNPYPKAEVAAAALGPRARHVSVHMEALGLWRPSMDPMQFDTPFPSSLHFVTLRYTSLHIVTLRYTSLHFVTTNNIDNYGKHGLSLTFPTLEMTFLIIKSIHLLTVDQYHPQEDVYKN